MDGVHGNLVETDQNGDALHRAKSEIKEEIKDLGMMIITSALSMKMKHAAIQRGQRAQDENKSASSHPGHVISRYQPLKG